MIELNLKKDAMKFFALKRTFGDRQSHFKGVETPSQRRFVKYFEEIVYKYNNSLPRRRMLGITKIILKALAISNFFYLLSSSIKSIYFLFIYSLF